MFYFMNIVLSYFCIEAPILSLIAGVSIIPMIYLLYSSFVFRYCVYHRIPLYYIIVSDAIAYYDIYFGIPVDYIILFKINCTIAGLTVFLTLYYKLKCQH